jgi:Carboxypeptidase regulatory-like domain
VVGGTILGTISDPSGGVVPRAQILIGNLENGTTRTVETDEAGFYAAPNLQPGTYEVKASAAGFAANAKTDITVTVGAQQLLNFTLNVGQVTENVQVNSASMIDLATSTVEGVQY